MHVTRQKRIEALHNFAADGRWEDVYRQHVLFEFPHEMRMGFQLAFLRPFCDPEMARVLVAAGKIAHSAQRRAYDTGIVIHEIIADGTDGVRARQMIAHMNRQHRHYPDITPEQMTYVLAAFVVAPGRYVERAGWRPMLDIERQAASRFYDRLGELMGIRVRHTSYETACQIVDDYEATNLRPNADTLELGGHLLRVLRNRLPWPVSTASGQIFASQINDPVVAHAVGLPQVSALTQLLSSSVNRTRRLILPHLPAPTKPSFAPGQPAGPYTGGYDLSQIEKP